MQNVLYNREQKSPRKEVAATRLFQTKSFCIKGTQQPMSFLHHGVLSFFAMAISSCDFNKSWGRWGVNFRMFKHVGQDLDFIFGGDPAFNHQLPDGIAGTKGENDSYVTYVCTGNNAHIILLRGTETEMKAHPAGTVIGNQRCAMSLCYH